MKYMSWFGLAVLGLTNALSAGCVASSASGKSAQKQSQSMRGDTPDVLYPKGYSETDPTFVIGAYYLGGYAGQNDRQVASSGTSTIQGSALYAPLNWSNGFIVDLVGTTAGRDGQSFGLTYWYVTESNVHSTLTDAEASIVNPYAQADGYSVATATYHLPFFMGGFATYARSLLMTPVFSLQAVLGFQAVGINHSIVADYTDDTDTEVYNWKETSAGAGPLTGIHFTAFMTNHFALRGTLFGAIPVTTNRVSQYTDSVVDNLINVRDSQVRQTFAATVNLDAVFAWDMGDMARVEFILGWATQQYMGLSRMLQASAQQAGSASNFGMNAVKAGFSFVF